jgi:hypothetical protein
MFSLVLFLLFLVFVSLLFSQQRKWWVKVDTQSPSCTYYFGPFDSCEEARSHHQGYVQDLQREGAQNITYSIEQYCPQQLTISEEDC